MPREMLYMRVRNVFNISLNINSEASGADFCQVKVMPGNLEKESKKGVQAREIAFGINIWYKISEFTQLSPI